jgi:hypothetical protein
MRKLAFASVLVLSAVVVASVVVAPAAAKRKRPPPPPPPPPPASSSTYVMSHANVLNGVKCYSVTPEVVEATSDGGSIALAHSDCRSVSWVIKSDAYGNPQWQKEVACFGLPPGGYALGLSLQQTTDGGYVIGGGTRDCQSSPICPYLTSQECGLIVKLGAAGNIVWSRVYSSSARNTGFEDVRQTSDGGFVAVGTFVDENSDIGAVVLKLDSAGNVQWQKLIGPAGRTHALLYAVQQTTDGGYVAAGSLYTASDSGQSGVLVVRLDSAGNVAWQRGFNSFDPSGAPTANEFVSSVIQTSEGGYAVAGAWGDTLPGTCCQGPLLLKLGSTGAIQWQKAYSGGIHCFFNGYWTQCYAVGGLAYSLHQTPDGGFALGGAGHVKFNDSLPMVPWLAKTDASGNLVWQHDYYDTNPASGRTLSQYLASSSPTSDGGYVALGFTENAVDLKGELFAVRTDSAGLVGGRCSQIHSATALNPIDPGLTAIVPPFAVRATTPAQGDLPAFTQATSIQTTGGGC